ncbi:MAG: hypothetical protein V1835_06220 [Candidatus Micrarchaeota archaeon]
MMLLKSKGLIIKPPRSEDEAYRLVVVNRHVGKRNRELFIPFNLPPALASRSNETIGHVWVNPVHKDHVHAALYPYGRLNLLGLGRHQKTLEGHNISVVAEGLAMAHYFLRKGSTMLSRSFDAEGQGRAYLENTGRLQSVTKGMSIEAELRAIYLYCSKKNSPVTDVFVRFYANKLVKRFPDRFREQRP